MPSIKGSQDAGKALNALIASTLPRCRIYFFCRRCWTSHSQGFLVSGKIVACSSPECSRYPTMWLMTVLCPFVQLGIASPLQAPQASRRWPSHVKCPRLKLQFLGAAWQSLMSNGRRWVTLHDISSFHSCNCKTELLRCWPPLYNLFVPHRLTAGSNRRCEKNRIRLKAPGWLIGISTIFCKEKGFEGISSPKIGSFGPEASMHHV